MKIGILGGGQLGRMLALAGYPLGLEFIILDPSPEACAGHLAEHLCADYADPAALARFCAHAQRVTFEFENVPVSIADRIASSLPLYPGAAALRASQDRLTEKNLFKELGIDVTPFRRVDSAQDLRDAVEVLGLPAILKSRRMGYDGKGQILLRGEQDLDGAWKKLGGQPLILEAWVNFRREISCLAVRAKNGATAFYPVVENQHRDGILRISRPRPDDSLQQMAERLTQRVLERLEYVGVLAFEFFDAGGHLLANEIAPRVHNSGHWSIEGAHCSQFENHLRAVSGLPLGPTTLRGYSAMVNFIGTKPDNERVLALPYAHLHDYDKKPKPSRKIGHATVLASEPALLETYVASLLSLIPETSQR